MGNLSGRSTFLVERHLSFIKTLVLSWSSRYGVQTSHGIYRVSQEFSWSFTFVHHNQDSSHDWSLNLNMNVKTLERSCKDESRTFFDNSAHSRLSWSRTDLPKEECRDGWNWFHLGKETSWGDETVRRVWLDDQRCNVNIIMYSTSLIRGIVLTWSWIALVIDWHQEHITIWIRYVINSTRVDCSTRKVVPIWLME